MGAEIKKMKIASSKGNVSVVIHYPTMKTERLAILSPGYLDSKDYKHLIGLAGALSERGYTAVRFDPTGTWESEGDISDYTTTQYLEDIKHILEYMLREADYTYVLLGGHSRGGMVSILYAARDPRISAVLGIMPSSGRSMVGHHYEEWKKSGFSISQRDLPNDKNKRMEYRVPYSHAEDRDAYNVVGDVEKVKVPILLIAGELDNLVLPEDVKEIFDHANEPKQFVIIPGLGHDYRHSDDEVTLLSRKVLELLNSMEG